MYISNIFHCIILHILQWLLDITFASTTGMFANTPATDLVALRSSSVIQDSSVSFIFVMLRHVALPVHLFSCTLFLTALSVSMGTFSQLFHFFKIDECTNHKVTNCS